MVRLRWNHGICQRQDFPDQTLPIRGLAERRRADPIGESIVKERIALSVIAAKKTCARL
jgi:hypothetical protein